jgi:cytochrome c-type biogenesis protein CcmH
MNLKRLLPGLALVAVIVTALVIGTSDRGPRSPEARATAIEADLRCPVCQGLSIADSHTQIADAFKDEIRRRVDAGESAAQIKASFVSRYGEWILLRPESSGAGATVWALPVVALVLAAGGLALAFRRWRREPRLPATDEDRALVEAALAEPGDGS